MEGKSFFENYPCVPENSLLKEKNDIPNNRQGPQLSVVVPCYNEKDNIKPLIVKLEKTLGQLDWEVIFVDDFSPDGTYQEIEKAARNNSHIRGICRVGRRGLSSAVIEGVLSSSADVVVVMDGDMQHDETRIAQMFALVQEGTCDMVVASRYIEGGDAEGLDGKRRYFLSHFGIELSRVLLSVRLTDPMSGFFAVKRSIFVDAVPRLSARGFKILLDLIISAPPSLRIQELPSRFKEREHGKSKLDLSVMVAFLFMIIEKKTKGVISPRFVLFLIITAFFTMAIYILQSAYPTSHEIGKVGIFAYDSILFAIFVVAFLLNNLITFYDVSLKKAKLLVGGMVFAIISFFCLSSFYILKTLLDFLLYHNSFFNTGITFLFQLVILYALSCFFVWRTK